MANDPSNPDTEIIYVRSDPTIQIPNRSRAGITVKVIGPPGPPGGNVGPQGDDGDDGWTVPGPQGNQGVKGNTGAAGISNTPGPPGEDGDEPYIMPGPQGNRGLQGVQGLPGQSNVPGPQGEDGEDSTFGVPGQQGAPGPKGDKGLQGYTSIGGLPGDDGDDGWIIPGAAGAAGPPGPTGPGTVAAVAFMATNTTNPDITTLDVVSFNTNPYNIGAYYNNGSCVWKPPAGVVALTVDIVGTSSHTASWIVYIYKNGVAIAQSQSGTNVLTGSLSCQDQASGSDSYWVEMALVPLALTTVSFKLTAGLCKFQGALMQGTQGQAGVSVRGFDGEDGDDGFSVPGAQGTPGAQGPSGAGTVGAPGIQGEDGDDGFPVPGQPGGIGPPGPAGPATLLPGVLSVLSLPVASFGNTGALAFVSDSEKSAAEGAGTYVMHASTGRGVPNLVPVYSDGVGWLIWAGGQQGPPGVSGVQGNQGAPGLTVPGRDGDDGDDVFAPSPGALLCAYNLWYGSQIFKGGIASTSVTTGDIVTAGGVGVGGSVFCNAVHANGPSAIGAAIDPNTTFTVGANVTDPTGQTSGLNIFRTLVLTANNAQSTIGGQSSVSCIGSTFNSTGENIGCIGTVLWQGSGIGSQLRGLKGYIYNTSTGNVAEGSGVISYLQNLNASGTFTNFKSFNADGQSGFNFGGAVTNWYGLYVNTPPSNCTNSWGVWVVGPTPSRFGGNVTVDTVLTVTGNVVANSALAVAGQFKASAAMVDAGYAYATPTTGSTVTLGNTVWHTIIDPAGALLALTVTMPASPVDGQIVDFKVSQAITTLTVSPNSGQSVVGGPAAGASVAGITYNAIYRSANTTWYF